MRWREQFVQGPGGGGTELSLTGEQPEMSWEGPAELGFSSKCNEQSLKDFKLSNDLALQYGFFCCLSFFWEASPMENVY